MAQQKSAAQESGGRQNKASLSERFSKALASIDRQAPTLTYLGLGC